MELLREFPTINIREGEYKVEQIYRAEAVWICNSLRHLIGVSRIDEHSFDSDHVFLRRLKEVFESHVQSKLEF